MRWKKNIISYLLWAVYAVAVCMCTYGAVMSVCGQYGYSRAAGICVVAVSGLTAGLFAFSLYKFAERRSDRKEKGNRELLRVLELTAVVILLGAGLLLRLHAAGSVADIAENQLYYEMAKVTDKQHLPRLLHAAGYLYLSVLRGVFLIFGNKPEAAVWLQTGLQLLSGIFVYLAMRRLSGVLGALTAFGFFMLSPYMQRAAVTLSPGAMLLVFYAVMLLVISFMIRKYKGGILFYFLTGLLIGIFGYLDVLGLTLLVLVFSVLTVRRRRAVLVCHKRYMVLLLNLFGMLLGLSAMLLLEALTEGKNIMAAVMSWFGLYAPKTFFYSSSYTGVTDMAEVCMLLMLLLIGVFSFWSSRQYGKQDVFIASALVLWLLLRFGMIPVETNALQFAYLFLAMLAGAGLDNAFVAVGIEEKTEHDREEQEDWADGLTDSFEISEAEERLPVEEIKADIPKKPQIKYLDNPLPLPKKHQPKVMDYRLKDMEENDDFALEISEDDDFDI